MKDPDHSNLEPSAEDASFESFLKGFKPAEPSPELTVKLRQALKKPASTSRSRLLLAGVGTCAALTLALALLLVAGYFQPSPPPDEAPVANNHALPPPPDTVEFLPATKSVQHLLSVEDYGIIRDDQNRAVQLWGASWLDEDFYSAPDSKRTLAESRVRHQIIPVVLPAY